MTVAPKEIDQNKDKEEYEEHTNNDACFVGRALSFGHCCDYKQKDRKKN